MSASDPFRRPEPAPEPAEADKEQKKADKLRKDVNRPLDSWERYRALADAVEANQDLIDLADHKARFALVIMGGINATLFIVLSRANVLRDVPPDVRAQIFAALAVYAGVIVYFLLQAIESLRPRQTRPNPRPPGPQGPDASLGLRFFADVLQKDLDSYRQAWRDVNMAQLNTEMATQAWVLARINDAKYAALRRLYRAMQAMVILASVFMVAVGFQVARSRATPERARRADRALLGTPERFTEIGAREPSGLAWHPELQHLFLVGDEGSLVELDLHGRVVSSTALKGNLEDVSVHLPTGNLALLSEKKSEILWYDARTRQELRRWELDRASLLGMEPADKNHGFEGIAFREDTSLPGGGVFYLVHQRFPEMIVGVTFDPEAPSGPLRPTVVSRWRISEKNVKAAVWSHQADRLLVLSARKGLVVLKGDGQSVLEVPLGGQQPEGLCLDRRGDLWVADDQDKALLRYEGALATLIGELARETGGGGE